jgi:hypothetical protein
MAGHSRLNIVLDSPLSVVEEVERETVIKQKNMKDQRENKGRSHLGTSNALIEPFNATLEFSI